MFRASLAGALLALSASTALAGPIDLGNGYEVGGVNDNYVLVTSTGAQQAPGTTTPPPVGGIVLGSDGVSVGGLCNPGDAATSCPTISNTFGYTQGEVSSVNPKPGQTAWVIPLMIPSEPPGSNLLLTFQIADDTYATLNGGPSPSTGDIFEVTANGHSLGTTSVVGLGGPDDPASSGTFGIIVHGGEDVDIGITDLLQPYANGMLDMLPSALCGVACSGLDGGAVQSAAFHANVVDFSPLSITPAPEPASLALVSGGLVALGLIRRRRRSQA